MLPKGARREEVLRRLEEAGGLRPGVAARIHRETGVPEADVYGVATFYHLLSHPDAGVRVCQGLSCKLGGCDDALAELEAAGVKASRVACLGRCDLAPAMWKQDGDPATAPCPITPSGEGLALDLASPEHAAYDGLAAVGERGTSWLLGELEASGLSGRGGAGFPAHRKWRAVCDQPVTERYLVLNADEGEPGTFKDREILLRRPHLVVEGLAIAAQVIGARAVYPYVRGEFRHVKASLARAVDEARADGRIDEALEWSFVDGHGAYICGEETALLESIEGRRGLPRLRPPYPVEVGLFGKPTLIHNVETIACVPQIARRGGDWFYGLGRTEPGTRLYCLSGHVKRPGVYEAPMGITLAELLALAGGTTGELKAFSPGGASSGFLPAERADLPLDFGSLREAGSMLGSAGIVVLDESADMVEAALTQAIFFEDESCGQCAPCRIGARMLRQALERYRGGTRSRGARPRARGRVGDGGGQHLRARAGGAAAAALGDEILAGGVRIGPGSGGPVRTLPTRDVPARSPAGTEPGRYHEMRRCGQLTSRPRRGRPPWRPITSAFAISGHGSRHSRPAPDFGARG